MAEIFTPDLLILLALATGFINLVSPFTSRPIRIRRSVLMLVISCLFLLNIIFIDFLYLDGIHGYLTLFVVGKFKIAFHLEPLGLIFVSLIAVLWIFALMYTINFLEFNQVEHTRRFLFFMNSAVFCGIFVAFSANLFTMFVGYELLTLSTIPLIAHKIFDNVYEGLMKYLKILMLSALMLFMPAMIIIYATLGTGDFTIDGIIEGGFSNHTAIILFLMFIFGIAKAALFPVHGWLPAAMVASYPVSALLHAVLVVKTGLFCIFKIIIYIFGIDYLSLLFADYNWLIIFPLITVIYSSIAALRTNQIKMILAYSTINQLAIALLSAFMLTEKAIFAAILHMVSHSFSKICLFYAAGNFYSARKTYTINQLNGIYQDLPKTSGVFLIACLSLIGIPPLAGFFSKFYIMNAALEVQNIIVVVALIFSTLCTATYVVRFISHIYKPVASGSEVVKLPKLMLTSLLGCVSFVILFIFMQRIIYALLMQI